MGGKKLKKMQSFEIAVFPAYAPPTLPLLIPTISPAPLRLFHPAVLLTQGGEQKT